MAGSEQTWFLRAREDRLLDSCHCQSPATVAQVWAVRSLALNSRPGPWPRGMGLFRSWGVLAPKAKASCDGLSPHPSSSTGDALLDAGESMKCLAEVKDSLDIEVKQNFIDPLQNLCDKDLKEIQVRPEHALGVPPSWVPTRPTTHARSGTGRMAFGMALPEVPEPAASVTRALPPAPPEEARGPPPGLRLQEEAAGQDPRRGAAPGPGEVRGVQGGGRDQHAQPPGDRRTSLPGATLRSP